MRILIAFISPISHALSNIVDNHMTNNLFKSIWTLTFYNACVSIFFLPLIFFVELPHFPPVSIWPFLFLIVIINIWYLYPYYKALQSDDTSIVCSLFSLGKVFVPIFAFFIVGETLTSIQYIGFIVIVLSSTLLTIKIEWKIKIKFNKSFWYMLWVSIMLSCEAVIYKYMFEAVSRSTGFLWTRILGIAAVFLFLCVPILRKDIFLHFTKARTALPILLGQESLDFLGSASATYVLSIVPVTLAKGISSTQSIFVLLYAIVLWRFFPHIFKEELTKSSIMKKILLFVVIIWGVVMVIR